MEEENFDKVLEDLKKKYSTEEMETRRIESVFLETYQNNWKNLSPEQKQKVIFKFKEFNSNAQEKAKLSNYLEKLEKFETTKSDIVILFLGVFLGISGNLLANLLDRYFIQMGCIYDIAIVILFIISVGCIHYFFIRKTQREITKDDTASELLKILGEPGLK